MDAAGRELGDLLSTDPTLRKLAVQHSFRPQGDSAEFVTATADRSAYLSQTLTGVRQAPVPTCAVLHEMARRKSPRRVSTTTGEGLPSPAPSGRTGR
jgi:hypothetical protein